MQGTNGASFIRMGSSYQETQLMIKVETMLRILGDSNAQDLGDSNAQDFGGDSRRLTP